jgi:hypothetical protein
VDKAVFRRRVSHLQSIKRDNTQLLHEPKVMIEERSAWDLSSQAEGETRLPRQTHTQPKNGQERKRMMVIRTLTCPLGGGR